MWVKVLTPFYGVKEGRKLRVGEVLEVTEARGITIMSRGLATGTSEPVKPKPKRKKRKKAKKPPEDKAERPKEDKGEQPIEE